MDAVTVGGGVTWLADTAEECHVIKSRAFLRRDDPRASTRNSYELEHSISTIHINIKYSQSSLRALSELIITDSPKNNRLSEVA